MLRRKIKRKTSEAPGVDHTFYAKALATFFLSGFCAVCYQVIWSRLLINVFGSTTQSIAIVLFVFMFGLGLGSLLSGKYLKKIKNPKNVYAKIEIILGLYSLVLILILQVIQKAHVFLFPYFYDSEFVLTVIRISLVSVALIIPTTLMGATFPILSQALHRDGSKIGRRIGSIYAINTVGAALGGFLSAFVMIPSVGLYWAICICAAINISIGLVILNTASEFHYRIPPDQHRVHEPMSVHRGAVFVLVAFAGVGFIGMLLENSWSRALVMVFGTSVYAFAIVLTTYLTGLGLGSLVAGWLADRIRLSNIPFTLSLIILFLGFAIYLTTPMIGQLPAWFATVFSDTNSTWREIVSFEFGVSFLLMIVPTFLSGSCLPFISRFIAQGHLVGRAAANAYAANTLGAIVGTLCAGFILIPKLGSERTLLLAGALAILIASGLLLMTFKQVRAAKYATVLGLAGIAVVGLFTLPSWDKMIMNSGVYVYAPFIDAEKQPITDFMKSYNMIYYKEGATATVAVLESQQGHRFLRVNGKTDGSSEGDNFTQMLIGYLPAVYAKALKRALVIGLGTGVTSSSLLDLPLNHVDTVEISPEVIAASAHFSELNQSVFHDSRSAVHLLDGRTWLAAMPRTYDIITSEPSHPWQTGNANLFTVDFFRIAAQRLNAGGIFCQWLPLYRIDSHHYKLIINSLLHVFPHVNIWLAATDSIIIGSKSPLEMDFSRIQSLFDSNSIKTKLNSLSITSPEALLSFFYLDDKRTEMLVSGVNQFNLDRHPVVEFESPKYLLSSFKSDLLFSILQLSYTGRLPLAVTDMTATNMARILARRPFYRKWHFSKKLTEMVIRQSLQHQVYTR